MISGYIAGEALATGRSIHSSLARHPITRAIQFHRKVLEAVKSMKPKDRRSLLLSIPENLHIKVALGRVGPKDLLTALIGRPNLLKLLRRFL